MRWARPISDTLTFPSSLGLSVGLCAPTQLCLWPLHPAGDPRSGSHLPCPHGPGVPAQSPIFSPCSLPRTTRTALTSSLSLSPHLPTLPSVCPQGSPDPSSWPSLSVTAAECVRGNAISLSRSSSGGTPGSWTSSSAGGPTWRASGTPARSSGSVRLWESGRLGGAGDIPLENQRSRKCPLMRILLGGHPGPGNAARYASH